MSKIPTAEEFFYPNVTKSRLRNTGISKKGCEELMIKFAKLHVEAALKEAGNVLNVDNDGDYINHPTRELIIKSYPLENIK